VFLVVREWTAQQEMHLGLVGCWVKGRRARATVSLSYLLNICSALFCFVKQWTTIGMASLNVWTGGVATGSRDICLLAVLILELLVHSAVRALGRFLLDEHII
jgi:hypothetical protein